MNDVMERVQWIIRAGTGEEWGDGYTVTDVCTGYAEPGYGSDDAVVVFGNWNNTNKHGTEPTKSDRAPSRMFDLIERAGAHGEWSDEWYQCSDCYRAMRCQPDSYMWTMYGAVVNECEPVCADCMRKDTDSYLEEYINTPDRAVTWCGPRELSAAGWTKYAGPDDERTYETGLHPGQDDDPRTVLAEILEDDPTSEVVFLVDSVGQFDARWSAWVKVADDKEMGA